MILFFFSRHSNADDAEKEEFSNKFKLAKEAYEVLSDMEKRKSYDSGGVKPPPGGWYQDIDQKIFQNVHPRGGIRGRGPIRGGRGERENERVGEVRGRLEEVDGSRMHLQPCAPNYDAPPLPTASEASGNVLTETKRFFDFYFYFFKL